MAIGTRSSSRRLLTRLGFRPRTSCAKTNSRRLSSASSEPVRTEVPSREPTRREARETSIEGSAWTFLSLFTRTTRNQAFPRVRIAKTRSGLETKIGCALPAQSLAGTATHQRRETDVWRVGQTV